MRKILTFLIAILLVLLIPEAYAYAAEKNYHLDDLGLSVTIPTSLVTFTRDTKMDDPNLETFGFTKEQIDSMMEDNNIYLDALATDGSYEIVVTMSEIAMDDFSVLSDDELLDFVDSLADGYAEKGVEVLKSEIYEHPQAKFVKTYIKVSSDAYTMQYYTIHDGKAICFNMHSYSGSLPIYQQGILKQIVDSVKFDIVPQEKSTKQNVPAVSARTSEKTVVGKLIIGAISGALAGAAASLYGIIKKKHGQRNKAEKSQSQLAPLSTVNSSPEAAPVSQQEDKELLFCSMCGTKLPKDSVFCYKCGAKVERE